MGRPEAATDPLRMYGETGDQRVHSAGADYVAVAESGTTRTCG
jgi:hypothetical protein